MIALKRVIIIPLYTCFYARHLVYKHRPRLLRFQAIQPIFLYPDLRLQQLPGLLAVTTKCCRSKTNSGFSNCPSKSCTSGNKPSGDDKHRRVANGGGTQLLLPVGMGFA